MFGLAIVAVGLLFLAFSLTYKCLMAKKQRTREAAEVARARQAEMAAQNEVRQWYSYQMGVPGSSDPPQPLPPDRPIPFKEPFFIAQPDGAMDVAIKVADEPPVTHQIPATKGGIVIQALDVEAP